VQQSDWGACEYGGSDRDLKQQPDAYVAGAVGDLAGTNVKLHRPLFAGLQAGWIRLFVAAHGVAQGLPREHSVRLTPRLTSAHPLGRDRIWLKRKLVATKKGRNRKVLMQINIILSSESNRRLQ